MVSLDAVKEYDAIYKQQVLEEVIDGLIKEYDFTYQDLVDILDVAACRSSGEKYKNNWTKAAEGLKLNRGTLLKMRRKCGMADG